MNILWENATEFDNSVKACLCHCHSAATQKCRRYLSTNKADTGRGRAVDRV